ncbi:SEC14-like protein 1 [Carassius carassius]|uniref:SEC14-like protein 1 n=1 Tax=Carassius carassius TaxID=217509 RepID=UPI0028685BCF|nr:SEC14-like protein 1 [Carassius carassius]
MLGQDYSMVETALSCREGESVQGSHVTRWPGFYILQWRLYSSPSCTSSSRPRVDDVLASLQVSSHKCRVMYFTEVLRSTDFRSVSLHHKVLSIKTPLTEKAHILKI